MKNQIVTLIVALFIGVSTYAGCTVTTKCNSYSFPNENSVSVSTQSTENGVRIVIKGANGKTLATETCSSASINQQCTNGDGGNTDICDVLPPSLAALFGCDD